uniref:Regucalcin n=1 Tax=Crassostrea virginica TaxID=6565 RepID=A0A8B8CRQ0_CRAVI|nr:regucalcin-like isoform X1 [Crassostrea virginica]XP_022318410.1 regucalcin-like isoform X1 [Crassostrea virginica]XP_022318411.1 regucalcin-like isoform X1 [Crassostrea virginica]
MSVECVLKNAAKLHGEGPHWDDVTNTLLYVDHYGKAIHRYNPETNADDKIVLDSTVGFAVPASKGGLIAGVGQCLVHVDWETKKVTKLHQVDQGLETSFNDGKCDPQGRVWAGTWGPPKPNITDMKKIGSLYCLDQDGSLRKAEQGIGISNGLAWSSDGKSMYYIDSAPRQMYKYDFDPSTGKIENRSVVIDNSGKSVSEFGYPDGMTFDTKGNIWVAHFLSKKVMCHDPKTGEVLQSIEFPAKRITSCCFGGKNLDELYVTSTDYEVPEEEMKEYPLSGSLFRVKGLGVKGYSANTYEGNVPA